LVCQLFHIHVTHHQLIITCMHTHRTPAGHSFSGHSPLLFHQLKGLVPTSYSARLAVKGGHIVDYIGAVRVTSIGGKTMFERLTTLDSHNMVM